MIALDVAYRVKRVELARNARRLKNVQRCIVSRIPSMRCLWSAVPALVVACISSASAQVQSVNRTASGAPDTDIRVGVYVNVRPDCTTGPLPSIQLTSPPENGKVTVKKAQVTATNYKQ